MAAYLFKSAKRYFHHSSRLSHKIHKNIKYPILQCKYFSSSTPTSSRLTARMNRTVKDPIQITAAAAERIEQILKGAQSNSNDATSEMIDGVKLGVQKGGCNGLEYTMNYATASNKKIDDLEVIQHGIKVVVENRALFYMVGTTVDYKEDDLRAGFVFNNPNVSSKCGCEMSFSV